MIVLPDGNLLSVNEQGAYSNNDEMQHLYAVCKTVEMRARREGRGFSDGSVQVVRDQGKT